MAQRKRLGDLLQDAGLVTEIQIEDAIEHKKPNQKLGDALLEHGYITEKQLIEVLEFQLGIPHVSLYQYPIDERVLGYVTREYAQEQYIMPLKIQDDQLMIAMKDPMDYFVIDDMELSTGLPIYPVIATQDDILYAINKHYYKQEDEMAATMTDDGAGTSVIELLDQILTTGIQLKASDIHLDPQEAHVDVRYRIDGQLRHDKVVPKSVQNSLIARIKILADLDITQTRLPQDGRIKTTIGVTPVDLRISSLPTVNGEKIVIRVLDLSNALRQIGELGFSQENLGKYKQLLGLPSGLVLLTGPTGSGKTSTLYGSIHELNQENVNMITIEDPVEFQMEGVNQVQVNPSVGLTFASGLRSILRQDPNTIMIGEIRDRETAEIAIRASLTGHLVFSTLHTNSALDAIPRLIDMGIEPYLVVSSLNGVVGQRLVRRICRDCKAEHELTSMERDIFKKYNIEVDHIYEGKGCSSCHYVGYRGRMAVHEVFVVDDTVRSMLLNERSMADIRTYATESGMSFLIHDGLEKVKNGQTTLEEIMQVSIRL
ncbi:Bacteriophage N4 adsorption protein [Lentibacillus sp. JNUCC-1]|uniref:GspE/PulE family protein n=1 Tax=Lentibacillus sp. JNUCC-1 TaxID=2654513 RepID=UPI0012E7BC7E|nr:ATPase, T2SS/T4P/T4SS family [Lentibacillus sp. JNUCC-1]MUV36830.1 Bacteriophage N4 adsorption protein [Lentibacillus sp. JNUCC-1]